MVLLLEVSGLTTALDHPATGSGGRAWLWQRRVVCLCPQHSLLEISALIKETTLTRTYPSTRAHARTHTHTHTHTHTLLQLRERLTSLTTGGGLGQFPALPDTLVLDSCPSEH